MPALGAPLDVAPPRPAPQTTSRARQHGAQPIVERRRQSAAVTAAAGRASVGGAKKKSPQNPLRGVPLKQALALQLGGDARNLIGWRVIEQQDSRPVGVVDEVLSFDDGGNVQQTYLKVIDEPAVSHLIPLVPDIVTGVHLRTKQVMLDAPEGLLDLGSVTAIIDELRQELEQYSGAPAGSTAEKMGIKCLPGAKQLENVGRGDLVALIRKAGGFAEVAYRLGWKPHRKPPGYWEDVKMLDQELTYFIAGSWLEEKNQEGEIVYRNQDMFSSPLEGMLPTALPIGIDHRRQRGCRWICQSCLK
ncbi:unnamed protein product [Ostreobium quekettii]|uniref:Uncharacterized protein n=1 Tax=Ostreobium quekettii TaxID=121088 RepID=A0A8S1ISK2_9CHLO|nr:unnamed protein product [Ostreobium quekettii]